MATVAETQKEAWKILGSAPADRAYHWLGTLPAQSTPPTSEEVDALDPWVMNTFNGGRQIAMSDAGAWKGFQHEVYVPPTDEVVRAGEWARAKWEERLAQTQYSSAERGDKMAQVEYALAEKEQVEYLAARDLQDGDQSLKKS